MSAPSPRTCASCFVSDKFPAAAVTDDGRCSLCHSDTAPINQRGRTTSNLAELRRIADDLKAQRPGGPHCLVGASGGLDSSYLVYIARRVLGLTPLVLHYDHGFNNEVSQENLRRMCRALDLELRIVRSPKSRDRKYVRSTVRALRKVGLYWGVCSFCQFIVPAVIIKCAREENVPVILTSSNGYEGRLRLTRRFKMGAMLRGVRRAGLANLPATALHLLIAQYHLLRLKLEFYTPPLSNLYDGHPRVPTDKMLNFTKYVPWDIDTMVETLQREVGWQPPAASAALPMRFDCKIEEGLLNSTFQQATGTTVHGIICNNMIYDGVRTKDELRGVVEHYEEIIEPRLNETMQQLGLKPSQPAPAADNRSPRISPTA
ncbi:MAG: ATP-binding protein [Phycisphaerae bacterium]|jgi:hypothetical protein